jgi:hypothetical protein
MSDQNIGRYRAIADECYARAEHARYVLDKEAWLKLAAEWTALAEGAAWRRSLEAQQWVSLTEHLLWRT